MNEDKTYSVEELTKMLTEANEKIQSQENEITSLNAKLDNVNTSLVRSDEQIKSLQKANMELYLKIPCNQTEEKEKGVDPKVSRKARKESTDWNSIINRF